MNMSVGLNIQNKIKNEINLNFQKKDLNYYQKAIPYLIKKAIQNTPKEAQERLNALLKPEVLALLAITGFALASPAGPIIGTGLTAWGLADLAVSLKTLLEGVINAKNINDLDNAAQTGSKIFIDALTKAAGAILGLLKSQKKLEALLSLLKKANPGVATKFEKVFNQLPIPKSSHSVPKNLALPVKPVKLKLREGKLTGRHPNRKFHRKNNQELKTNLSTNDSHHFTPDEKSIKILIQMVNAHKNIELTPLSERQQLYLSLINSLNHPKAKDLMSQIDDALDKIDEGNYKSMIKPLLEGKIPIDNLTPYDKGQCYIILQEFRKFVYASLKQNSKKAVIDPYYAGENISAQKPGLGSDEEEKIIRQIDEILVRLAQGRITAPKLWTHESINNRKDGWAPPEWKDIQDHN